MKYRTSTGCWGANSRRAKFGLGFGEPSWRRNRGRIGAWPGKSGGMGEAWKRPQHIRSPGGRSSLVFIREREVEYNWDMKSKGKERWEINWGSGQEQLCQGSSLCWKIRRESVQMEKIPICFIRSQLHMEHIWHREGGRWKASAHRRLRDGCTWWDLGQAGLVPLQEELRAGSCLWEPRAQLCELDTLVTSFNEGDHYEDNEKGKKIPLNTGQQTF